MCTHGCRLRHRRSGRPHHHASGADYNSNHVHGTDNHGRLDVHFHVHFHIHDNHRRLDVHVHVHVHVHHNHHRDRDGHDNDNHDRNHDHNHTAAATERICYLRSRVRRLPRRGPGRRGRAGAGIGGAHRRVLRCPTPCHHHDRKKRYAEFCGATQRGRGPRSYRPHSLLLGDSVKSFTKWDFRP